MNVREIFEWSYSEYVENTCGETKYEWAASEIFNLITYDAGLDELFVKKIIEVCKVILNNENYEYIRDNSNYSVFILVCQLLYNFNWIDWGTSIRGAWFGPSRNSGYLLGSEEITYIDDDGEWKRKGHPDIPFTKENLKIFIEFMEKES